MSTTELIKRKRGRILEIGKRYGASNIRIFGSVARGEAGEQSDIDFLIDLEPGRSLLDQVEFTAELEEMLGCKVDVLTEKGLYWLLRRRILKEAQPL